MVVVGDLKKVLLGVLLVAMARVIQLKLFKNILSKIIDTEHFCICGINLNVSWEQFCRKMKK